MGRRVYSTGFEFDLVAVLRRAERRGFPTWETIWHPERHDEQVPDEFIWVGLQLVDGSKVTNLDHIAPPSLDEEPQRPVLVMGSGVAATAGLTLRTGCGRCRRRGRSHWWFSARRGALHRPGFTWTAWRSERRPAGPSTCGRASRPWWTIGRPDQLDC